MRARLTRIVRIWFRAFVRQLASARNLVKATVTVRAASSEPRLLTLRTAPVRTPARVLYAHVSVGEALSAQAAQRVLTRAASSRLAGRSTGERRRMLQIQSAAPFGKDLRLELWRTVAVFANGLLFLRLLSASSGCRFPLQARAYSANDTRVDAGGSNIVHVVMWKRSGW